MFRIPIWQVDQEEHEQATVQQNATSFMAEHGLPTALRQRIHRFLHLEHERGTARERLIFKQLPPPLQLEAAKHLRLELLQQSELATVGRPQIAVAPTITRRFHATCNPSSNVDVRRWCIRLHWPGSLLR